MNSMSTIRTEEANEKYQQTARRIRLLKEAAAAARTIAGKLDGMYITKRVADKAKEIFPGYHAYLDKTYSLPQLALHNSSMSYGETFYIRLCENGGKRIDAEIVKAEADKRESEAVQLEKKHEKDFGYRLGAAQLQSWTSTGNPSRTYGLRSREVPLFGFDHARRGNILPCHKHPLKRK